jgi:muramoyltetrapeptide carboxypeptidase
MMPVRWPRPLDPGDRLVAIAPSGTLLERSAFEAGVDLWRAQGYRVEFAEGWDERWGYLAGRDDVRLGALREAWLDPDCRGILCVRGGWGAARLLEHWRWPEPSEPKWLIGFSDITTLLWSLLAAGYGSLHAPVLTTLAAEPDWSRQRLFDLVQGKQPVPLQGRPWVSGTAEGLLLPGNLTVATHLLATPWLPPLAGVILAIEDVTEAPYRIDRLLTQWRLSGCLSQVRGIAVGRFSQCDPPANRPSLSVAEVLGDRLGDLGIPVVAELPFGHDGENAALPVGQWVHLDGNAGQMSWTQPESDPQAPQGRLLG